MPDISHEVADKVSSQLVNKGITEKGRRDTEHANIVLLYEGRVNKRRGFAQVDYYHWTEASQDPKPDADKEAKAFADAVVKQIVGGGVDWPEE